MRPAASPRAIAVGAVALLLSAAATALVLGPEYVPAAPPAAQDPGAPPAARAPIPAPLAPAAAGASAPIAVVAIIDSGINPYHVAFRDASPLGRAHPSTFVPGYPEDAEALSLTLDAPSYEEAIRADADAWSAVEAGKLYWIPGTRIIGLVSIERDGRVAGLDENGHGTMTASRAAGEGTSLAPGARIVAIEGIGAPAVAWAAAQSWIDVQSNSWAYLVPGAGLTGLEAAFADAAARQVVLAATGNGLAQFAGVLGTPTYASGTTGSPGVLGIGGHDNGEWTTWSGTTPHLVADACWNPAAAHDSLAEINPRGGTGTSSATPFAAGAAVGLVLEARRLLGDVGERDGDRTILARAAPSALLPASGPLADGDLTLEELRATLLRTADPRPSPTPLDGESCGPAGIPGYPTAPLAWRNLPPGAPAYYFVGYGAVDERSFAVATSVLAGEAGAPARSAEDALFGLDQDVRAASGRGSPIPLPARLDQGTDRKG